ncbi:MXAN_2756 family trypsin-like serine endoprotease [Citreicoccus inhibens]|uniref:MXAN_2756 family trypsin-like serine endoprotease n=1 Tax=Citreicoccus inhibens TaxID=2849499 RepID=UPI001F2C3289|nr:serine protease [Citreicoccus inhibens]
MFPAPSPRVFVLTCLALAAPVLADEDARPSRADLTRALELHARSTVRVIGPKQTGLGIVVGTQGQILTSVQYVGLESAEVEHDGQARPAKVVLANARLKVALVSAPGEAWPAAPVRLPPEGLVGRWVVGVEPGRRGQPSTPRAALARSAPEPFFDVGLALPVGSPVFGADGRLVAVVVERRGKQGARALPLSAVKAQLASAATP